MNKIKKQYLKKITKLLLDDSISREEYLLNFVRSVQFAAWEKFVKDRGEPNCDETWNDGIEMVDATVNLYAFIIDNLPPESREDFLASLGSFKIIFDELSKKQNFSKS